MLKVATDYQCALLDLAREFEEAFAYERDRFLGAFPDGGIEFMTKCQHRAELFNQLAIMMRDRAKTDPQRTGDETV